MDTNLCRICLTSNADIALSSNTHLSKFFIHVLGIHDPTGNVWLCGWCKSILRKTARLIQLAEVSQSFLINLQKNKIKQFNFNEHTSKLFNLSLHNTQHNDIEPKECTKPKSKSKKSKTNNIQFIDLNDSDDVDEIKIENNTMEFKEIKLENDKIEVKDVKLENDKLEEIDLDDVLDTEMTELTDMCDDRNEGEPKKKVDPNLYEKCEKNKFTLKILSLEEQIAELEQKKKSEKYFNRKYKCEYCGIGFVTTHVFEEHMKKHEVSFTPYKCNICHLHLNSSLVLAQHILAHGRQFHCQLCGTILSRFTDCQRHRLKCGQPTPGVCPHCKKVFSNLISLDEHIRGVHYSKEKRFVCSYCNQRFQTSQRLAIHTRTHTGAKPYSCELCHRTFASNSNLRYHRATHGHARPFYCVECDKSYKTSKGLRRHLRQGATHLRKNIHSCHHCLKNYASEKLLASHISSMHAKEIDACDIFDVRKHEETSTKRSRLSDVK